MDQIPNLPNGPNEEDFGTNFELFVKFCSDSWRLASKRFYRLLKKYKLNHYADRLAKKPGLAVGIFLMLCVTLVPLAIFIIFVLTTVLCGITGFVIIEGTLVTVATILLIGCLLSIWLVLGVIGLAITSFYYITVYTYKNMKDSDFKLGHKSSIAKADNKLSESIKVE